jgi:hypothetical protein
MADVPNIIVKPTLPSPVIENAQLFARKKDPKAAFEKYDAKGTGVVDTEGLRSAMRELGVQLDSREAAALIIKQRGDGDRAGPKAFNYKDFLDQHGASISRSEAASHKFSSAEDYQATTSVENPVPTPSAAKAIIERLRRERGDHGEGYMVSLTAGPPKAKVEIPDFIKHGEITDVGGLTQYLADEHSGDTHVDGYLPLMPGQKFAKRTIDDKIYVRGDFTDVGISGFIHTEAPPLPEGYVQFPGEVMKQRTVDPLHHESELRNVSICANTFFLAEWATCTMLIRDCSGCCTII